MSLLHTCGRSPAGAWPPAQSDSRPAGRCVSRPAQCAASRPEAPEARRESPLEAAWKRCAAGLAAAALVASTSLALPPDADALLTAGDPVKNARALLRYALPIDNKTVRTIQVELEGISEQLRIPGNKALGPVGRAVRKAKSTLGNGKAKLENDFAPDKKAAGQAAIRSLDKSLDEFLVLVDANDKQEVPLKQQEALGYVGAIEEAMVKGFPFSVPAKYSDLPQLKGRANLTMDIKLREAREGGVTGGRMTIVVDGYNAPVTGGNFIDLVKRGFYDGMEIQRADGFVVQTGDPGPPDNAFVEESGKVRRIPFEVLVKGDKAPTYEDTLEDLGRFNEQPALPFNAYGTMALARGEFETNSGSSQIFWLLKESELTPSGANLLDGRYAVFGYVVDGQELLQQMQVGDKIEKVTIVDGLQYLQQPKGSPA